LYAIYLTELSLVAVTPAGEVIGHVLGTRGHVGRDPVLALGEPLAALLGGMFTYPEPFDRT
jgi:hypothetical protein